MRKVAEEIGAAGVHHSSGVSKVSIVGLGMRVHSGVAQRMFQALASRGINVKMITTSDIKISTLVAEEDAVEALRAVHAEFQLDKPLVEDQQGVTYQPKHELLQPKGSLPKDCKRSHEACPPWKTSSSAGSTSTITRRG